MDLERILFWIAVASCLIFLAGLGRSALSSARGWAAVAGLILAMAPILAWLWPGQAGWLVGTLWILLLLLPALLTRLALDGVLHQRIRLARRCAQAVGLLHPFDGWCYQPKLFEVLELAQRGEPEKAAALLSELQGDPRLPARMVPAVQAQLFRLREDWEAIVALPEAGSAGLLRSMRVRALGETGRLRAMIASLPAGGHGIIQQLCWLFALAFCGRRAAVEDLLAGALARLDPDSKAFWLATAELASTAHREAGIDRMSALAALDRPVGRMARRRLATGLARPDDVLHAEHWQALDAAEARMRGEAALSPPAYAAWRRAYVITGLVALNIAAFGVELWLGGSDSPRVLYRLGAMWPPAVMPHGQWWRLVTASFLHFGPVHLAFNMLTLVVVGLWVEAAIGHWRTLVVYLMAGIGSSAAVLLMVRHGWLDNQLLAGASGAIFGLVGAHIVMLAHGWRRLRTRRAAQRLMSFAAIILAQAIFDLSVPQVSFSAHASGLLIGLALTGVLMVGRHPAHPRSAISLPG